MNITLTYAQNKYVYNMTTLPIPTDLLVSVSTHNIPKLVITNLNLVIQGEYASYNINNILQYYNEQGPFQYIEPDLAYILMKLNCEQASPADKEICHHVLKKYKNRVSILSHFIKSIMKGSNINYGCSILWFTLYQQHQRITLNKIKFWIKTISHYHLNHRELFNEINIQIIKKVGLKKIDNWINRKAANSLVKIKLIKPSYYLPIYYTQLPM